MEIGASIYFGAPAVIADLPEAIAYNLEKARLDFVCLVPAIVSQYVGVHSWRRNLGEQNGLEEIRNQLSVQYDVDADRFSVDLNRASELRPLSYCFEVTNACHYSCDFCIVSDHRKQPPYTVSESILRSLTDTGTVRIGFSGGEPLLIQGIYDLGTLARERGAITLLRTTGTRPVDLPRCLDSFHWVDISMDGADEETYHSMRGRPGFEQACATVTQLAHAGVRVRLNSLLSTVNRQQVLAIAKLAQDLGAKQLRFLPLVKRGGAAIQSVADRHNLTESELAEQEEVIKGAASLHPSISISILRTTKEEALFIVKPNGDLVYPRGSLLIRLGNVVDASPLSLVPSALLKSHCHSYSKHNTPMSLAS